MGSNNQNGRPGIIPFGYGGYGGGAPPYVFQTAGGGGFMQNNTGGGGADGGSGSWSGIGNWIKGNPGDVIKYGTEALGLGLGAYDAYKNRQQTQQQLDIANKQQQQEYGIQQQQLAQQEQQYQLNALNAQRAFESDTAERMRRRAAIQQILQMNKTDATGGNARATPDGTTGDT